MVDDGTLDKHLDLMWSKSESPDWIHLLPGHPWMKPTDEDLDNRFRYHPPDEAARAKHEKVTERTLELAKEFRDLLPPGRNLSIVLTLLEDVRMRANAAIACDSE